MKTISELNGVDFLRQCNKIRHEVSSILKNTKVMEIRKKVPVYEDTDTKEIRLKKLEEQQKKNLDEMLDIILEEKAEDTVKLFDLLIIKEDGDKELPGIELAMTGFQILSDKRVVDFLLSLMRLADQATAG